MSRPHGYVDSAYLQATAELLHHNKHRSYEWMRVQRGHRVLDVGCGPGLDTLALAPLVGPRGQVLGLDADAAMVAEAQHRARTAGVEGWVTHEVGDATQLPYARASFDACRSERLFQHLGAAPQALAEMVRVTKGGDWVVVLDTDWGTLSFDSPAVDIERRLARVRAEQFLANGYAGRQLYRLAKEQRLEDVQVELFPTVVTVYSVARTERSLMRSSAMRCAAGPSPPRNYSGGRPAWTTRRRGGPSLPVCARCWWLVGRDERSAAEVPTPVAGCAQPACDDAALCIMTMQSCSRPRRCISA